VQLRRARLWQRLRACAALLTGMWLAGLYAVVAHAGMQLDRTRVIVTQTGGSTVVQASNPDQTPVLLQVWVEPGEDSLHATAYGASPAPTPFLVEPPVLRLEPDDARALQVWLTDPPQTLPEDRESQFWLSVLEVPADGLDNDGAAMDAQGGGSRLELTVLTQIKLFYRPAMLADYRRSDEDRLRFSLERDAQGLYCLSIHNPAPIHQSLDTLALHQQGMANPMRLDAPMIAPFGKYRIQLPQNFVPARDLRASFVNLGDRGERIHDEQKLLLSISKVKTTGFSR